MIRFARFVLGFGIARTALFVAPIVLANLLPVELYGRLELAQATGVLAAMVIGMGLPASVPLVLLRDEVRARWDSLLAVMIALSGVLLLIGAANACLFAPLSLPALLPLATSILLLQGLWATTLKSKGMSTASVFLEGGFWLFALLGGAIALAIGADHHFVSLMLAIYAGGLFASTVRSFKAARAPFGWGDIVENLRVGLPLMAMGIMSVAVSNLGRMIPGYAAGAELAGYYANLFRATAIPIVGHQILVIGQFRNLFSWDENLLARRAIVIPAGVTALALMFWFAIDDFGYLLGARFAQASVQFRWPTLLILAQTVLWSAIALNDLFNSRLLLAGRVARYAAAYLAGAIPILIVITAVAKDGGTIGNTLLIFSASQSAVMVGFFLIQCAVSWANGHRFLAPWGTALAGYGFLLAVFAMGEAI